MNPSARVLMVGGNGQLGQELQKSFSGSVQLTVADRADADLTSEASIRDLVRRTSPHVILNAAAYTAVDRAESEPDLAMAVNGRAPGVLAEEAHRAGALLVHYSTDYVFNGSKQEPWTEDDLPDPLNVYGRTKLAGEEAIRRVGGRYLIFRTSWVYSSHGNNFLLTMLRLGRERERLTVVDDQFGAPTSASELARATRAVVEAALDGRCGAPEKWAGLYHMTCSGSATWYGFAGAIFERAQRLLAGRRPVVAPIPSSGYPTPARRPRNSVLSNARLGERFGVHLASWQNALDDVLREIPEPSAPRPQPSSQP